MFRWSKFIMLGLAIVTFIFSMIAISEVGFPYRPKTSVMRVNFLVSWTLYIRQFLIKCIPLLTACASRLLRV